MLVPVGVVDGHKEPFEAGFGKIWRRVVVLVDGWVEEHWMEEAE